jgi:arylsulfatase A-like enzyme
MMRRREFLRAAVVGASGCLIPAWTRGTDSRPWNIIFILVDDLGWTDLGGFGSAFYETPHIDKLLSRGMKFTDAYAACPVCSPTRASIMTGKYPVRLQTTDFFGAAQPATWKRNTKLLPAAYEDRLPLGETTLAEVFKDGGYATFFAGKWHLGPEGYYPENQGFDINRGGWQSGGPYGGNKYFSPYGNPRLADGPTGEHLSARLAAETVKFIEDNRARPFLAYLSFYSVHTPLMSRADLERKYEDKRKKLGLAEKWGREHLRKVRLVQEHAIYAGMVEAVDQAVGAVADALDRLGLADKTAVLFMSDNGGLSTSEGFPTSNLPLRAGKGWLYEGGIRVPMFIVWPGVARPASVCRVPVVSTDFYPTLLDMAGLPLKPRQHLDGLSLAPLLRSESVLEREAIFWHYPHYGNQGGAPGAAVRAGDWKLLLWYEEKSLELFNLRQDIGEKNNLVDNLPEKTAELNGLLTRWLKQSGAVFPSKNPDYDSKKTEGR